VTWNEAPQKLFGYPAAEVGATVDWWIERLHPEDRIPILSSLQAVRESGDETWFGEYRFRRWDGSYATVLNRSCIVRDANGAPSRIIGAMTDISEHKRLEEQLRQAQKMEAIGRLAGGVAHDFNNLLEVIIGFSILLLNRLTAEDPLRPGLEQIQKAGERAASLTRQLLAFSRKQVWTPRVIDLNESVLQLDKMLRRLIGEDIELVTAPDPTAGPVKADPSQIEQVILNLAVNARDAMPQGGKLILETRNVELDEAEAARLGGIVPGSHVMLSVTDTGCGMDAEVQAHIFEPFFTTKEPGRGTGLGLATVYGIVQQSGGQVDVESAPGRGTRFRIYLPRVEGGERSPEDEAAPARLLDGTETILLVEDEQVVRELVRYILQTHGYLVLEASSAGEALLLCERHPGPIQLLVTDVVMPWMSGREMAERLTALRPELRVLYMSGYLDDAVVRHGVSYGDTAFLQKPFTPDALARKAREVLEER
jgi:PAS domain S-box-containing protein